VIGFSPPRSHVGTDGNARDPKGHPRLIQQSENWERNTAGFKCLRTVER
jgi:hypothetical protein